MQVDKQLSIPPCRIQRCADGWDIDPPQEINETTTGVRWPKFLLDRYLAACSSDVQPDLPQRTDKLLPEHESNWSCWRDSAERSALNPIGLHSLVAARPESIGAAGGGVFSFAAADPLAPKLER